MNIPQYPESRPLELSDKPFLDDLFGSLQPRISELTFAGLYLFRAAHAYRLTMLDDSLVVLGEGYDRVPYFLPPLSGSIRQASLRLLGEGITLYGADEFFLETHLQDAAVETFADRDNFDYLYLRSELAELRGNRYHKKKNRINYFISRHDSTSPPAEDQP